MLALSVVGLVTIGLIMVYSATFDWSIQEFGDPFVVVGDYGKGKSMAFASDIAPHWGAGFMKWQGYDQFWIQAIRWLAAKE